MNVATDATTALSNMWDSFSGYFNTTVSEGRGIFAMDAPIFYIIGWLTAAYFVIYFVTFIAGPTLFGTRPYRPWYPYDYGRQLHNISKRDVSSPGTMDSAVNLVSNVLESIEHAYDNY